MVLDLFEAMVDSVSVRLKNASVSKNAFKHSYTVECGNRLRVEVRAKSASVSGFACRPFYVLVPSLLTSEAGFACLADPNLLKLRKSRLVLSIFQRAVKGG